MVKGKFDKINMMIEEIEKKNEILENFLESLPFSTRNDYIKDIISDFLVKNKIFEELDISIEKIFKDNKKKTPVMEKIVNDIISNIKNNPNKRIIYIKEFLNLFQEMAESDKNVILQSLKDEKIENLSEKMTSLIKMFDLRI